ncbi:hypothetical protein N7492_000587 [Penicillium capsulatum]|uniref:HypA-like protein n=1 Tax=Penicillium capsulatum TaxID=69766 RepID=A0A9W9IW63_9EURO|nr:hypothetical protein N7492_000587 [Penicillium capsulatum]KAJ6130355.1 hypothetical protein N7512_003135 [Penicillium capsulatum]
MASATKIHLSPATDSGAFSTGVREDTARVASELLQEDMMKHHVFFNDRGFHNHIVHMILSLYALGATPEDIRAGWERSTVYQRPVYPTDSSIVDALQDQAKFQQCFGKEVHYPNFLAFFQREIDSKGVGAVLNEYVFAGDVRAESMLCRVFGGLLHPFIHLGYGLEFKQPAIVAQALAQAAVHNDRVGRNFSLPAEQMAEETGKPGQKSLRQLLDEVRQNQTLTRGVKVSDRIPDGIMDRAPQEMLKYAAQYTVSASQIAEREADMINTVVYYTSAAQRKNKANKLDFFLLHCVNSSIFFCKILRLPYLTEQTKLRLLEWKGRLDLLIYVSAGSPDLLLDEVTSYPAKTDWNTVFSRGLAHPTDDGHLVKFLRAIAHGERVCRAFEDSKMPISGDAWLRIGNMAIDSTAGPDGERTMWVRSAGFDEAWENVSAHARL